MNSKCVQVTEGMDLKEEGIDLVNELIVVLLDIQQEKATGEAVVAHINDQIVHLLALRKVLHSIGRPQ